MRLVRTIDIMTDVAKQDACYEALGFLRRMFGCTWGSVISGYRMVVLTKIKVGLTDFSRIFPETPGLCEALQVAWCVARGGRAVGVPLT